MDESVWSMSPAKAQRYLDEVLADLPRSEVRRRKIRAARIKPRQKLFSVSPFGKPEPQEYISAFDEYGACIKYSKLHPQAVPYSYSAQKIPNEWEIRFPLIWKRIASAMLLNQNKQRNRWLNELNFVWAEIGDEYKKRYDTWSKNWIDMWEDIGISAHNTWFRCLEID